MSQKVCICGREKSKEMPFLITICACKKKHVFRYKVNSKTNKNDENPPNEDDEPGTTANDKIQTLGYTPQSKAEQGKLSPIYENSSQSLRKAPEPSLGQSSSHRTPETHSRNGSNEQGISTKISNKSKPRSKTSTKSNMKEPSTIQENQPGSPVSRKSVHSLSKSTSTEPHPDKPSSFKTGTAEPKTSNNSKISSKSIMRQSSAGKISPRKLSFNKNDELLMTSTPAGRLDTQSLEDAEEVGEEAKEEPITDHILFCEEDNLIRVRSRGFSEETICGLDGFVEKTISPRLPYKILERPRAKASNTSGPVETRVTKPKSVDADITEFLKDKIPNFPSDGTLKLPRLTPRYHGPGCAMEISVLEKHGKKCSYKKQKNPDRNPTDDRAGSYDVIGRIMFKTCGVGSIDLKDTIGPIKPSNPKLAELYSLLHLPVMDNKSFILNTSISDNQVEPVKSPPSSIIVSSKSFPNNFCGNAVAEGYWRERRACDLEDLYASNGKADKSIQMNDEHRKKWYYSLFSCIFEKSRS